MEIYHNEWIFQNNITSPSNGASLASNRCDQVTFYISGTSTSRQIYFEGSDNEGNWYAIPAVKLPELTIATSTTDNNTSYVINVTNYVSVRARVSAVAGGTVRITGKIVESNINLMNAVSAKVNESVLPDGAATEAKQISIEEKIDTIDTVLDSIAAEDFATETTLSTISGYINQLKTILTNIKNTDGIKKITDALPKGENKIGNVGVLGRQIVAAGKKTDAVSTDNLIGTTGFGYISIINEGTSDLFIAIDEDTTTSDKLIEVKAGEGFSEAINGNDLHYTIISGSCVFRYVLSI
jgi:hypothetical protein